MDVPIEIDLTKTASGYAGTFGQPAQKVKGLPLADIVVNGASVTFRIKSNAPGERVFKGNLSEDRQAMSGDYTQEGHALPFALARKGEARLAPATVSQAVAREFAGTWEATLEVKGVRRRYTLTLVNQPDGTSSAALVNVEEGLEIPVAAITQEARRLTLQLPAIDAPFSGTLNAAGAELTGTLTQGTVTRPIAFRRAATPPRK